MDTSLLCGKDDIHYEILLSIWVIMPMTLQFPLALHLLLSEITFRLQNLFTESVHNYYHLNKMSDNER